MQNTSIFYRKKAKRAWCIENEFHPNKTLGQNFLIDRNALVSIVDAGLEGVAPGARVLEIGPGMGVLTEEMLNRGYEVVPCPFPQGGCPDIARISPPYVLQRQI